jgi:hypothetical protein
MDIMAGFWLGFLYVAPPTTPFSPFFRVKSHVVPQFSEQKKAGERGERGSVNACVCFYLSWWRSFQGASARDNAKGVEIMKLMIVCIMRDTRISISSFGIPREQARGVSAVLRE